MRSLEKIVNFVRISPHGLASMSFAGILIADMNYKLAEENPLLPYLIAESVTTGISLGFGSAILAYGIGNYRRFKKTLNKRGIDKRHVEKNLEIYCDRQAYKAAAYSCGLGEEFDKVNRSYTGKRHFRWMPEV